MRTFFTRRTDIMKQLWKTLIQCDIDYCSQLYMPGQTKGMQAIEKLLYDFSSKIPEIREESYWKRLVILKMYFSGKKNGKIQNYKCMEDFGGPSAKLWRFASSIKCKTRKKIPNTKFESK